MITVLCVSVPVLLIGVLAGPDPIERKRRQWRAESDIGPALQERWLKL